MKKLIFILFTLGLLIVFSCAKDGAVGPSGAKGTDGNANVYYSNWTTLAQPWRDTVIDNTNLKYNYQDATVLTQNMLDSAAVLAYMKYISTINPLPYTSYAGGKTNTLNYFLGVGRIYYTRFNIDNTVVGASSTIQYRYVVIPGGVHTLKTASNTDYNYICNKYNIPK